MNSNDDYAKKLLFATRMCAFCAMAALFFLLTAAIVLLPRVIGAADELSRAAANLNAVDWQTLAGEFNEAAENFSEIDFEKFNQVIGDLQKAISPIAGLFGR